MGLLLSSTVAHFHAASAGSLNMDPLPRECYNCKNIKRRGKWEEEEKEKGLSARKTATRHKHLTPLFPGNILIQLYIIAIQTAFFCGFFPLLMSIFLGKCGLLNTFKFFQKTHSRKIHHLLFYF